MKTEVVDGMQVVLLTEVVNDGVGQTCGAGDGYDVLGTAGGMVLIARSASDVPIWVSSKHVVPEVQLGWEDARDLPGWEFSTWVEDWHAGPNSRLSHALVVEVTESCCPRCLGSHNPLSDLDGDDRVYLQCAECGVVTVLDTETESW